MKMKLIFENLKVVVPYDSSTGILPEILHTIVVGEHAILSYTYVDEFEIDRVGDFFRLSFELSGRTYYLFHCNDDKIGFIANIDDAKIMELHGSNLIYVPKNVDLKSGSWSEFRKTPTHSLHLAIDENGADYLSDYLDAYTPDKRYVYLAKDVS